MTEVPRALEKKSREERSRESRRQILDSAMKLFYEKGYEATTTRDIIKEAGILNGSLYNRFKSKEDILLALVDESVSDFLRLSESLFSSTHAVNVFAVPAALVLYISSHSRKMASLIFNASCSRAAVDMYLKNFRSWARIVLGPDYDIRWDGIVGMKVEALIGMLGNLCGQYAYGLDVPLHDSLRFMTRISAQAMELDGFEIDVDDMIRYVGSLDITICGVRVRDLPDFVRRPASTSTIRNPYYTRARMRSS